MSTYFFINTTKSGEAIQNIIRLHINPGQYYIVIKRRNHLPTRINEPVNSSKG